MAFLCIDDGGWLVTRKDAIKLICLASIVCLSTQACSGLEDRQMEPQPTKETEFVLTLTPYESGVEGHVWIGPTCPVVRIGTECPDQPYETELSVTDLDGMVVAVAKSDVNGYFRVPLPPGRYILVPETPHSHAPPFTQPIPFEVIPGSFTQLTVNYDSGIR